MRIALRALAVCLVAACGGSSGGDEGDDDGDGRDEAQASLAIDPATAEVTISNGAPATQQYTARLVWPDDYEVDVTSETSFSVDAAFGSFDDTNVATIRTAGRISVVGTRGDESVTAQLVARVRSQRVDPELPATTPELFSGPEDPSRAPAVVYPPPDVAMPRNIGGFETHWTDASGNDVFEVSLKTELADVRIYVRGGNGLASAGPMASWAAFSAQEWLDGIGVEGAVSYQVRGAQLADRTGPVGASAARVVKLSNEEMTGGVYYWSASAQGGAFGIYRHDMARPGEAAEEYMTTNQTAGRCVSCHVVSRDGTRMSMTYDGASSNATMVDVATRTAQPETAPWNFATFTPDGAKLLTVYAGTLVVRDSTTQTVLATMPASGLVSHPDLSPEGTRLVYVVRPDGDDWDFTGGRIFTRSYDATTDAFGAETPLITDGANNFYPSWSPDGQWVLFNRSDGGSAYNNANASMSAVKADGSAPPIELAAANQGLGLANAWARWAPFAQSLDAAGEPIYWIAVQSRRAFGVRLAAGQSQIWMSAFRPDAANAGQDPTTGAFHVPFQDPTRSNRIAQWTERVVAAQ